MDLIAANHQNVKQAFHQSFPPSGFKSQFVSFNPLIETNVDMLT